jgi:PAS domain S-box-containing protein
MSLGGVAISLLLGWLLSVREEKLAEVQFNLDASKRIEALRRAVVDRLGVVSTVGAFFAGSETVDRKEFHTFTVPLIRNHPGTHSLMWAPRIPAAHREAHQQAVRRQGLSTYTVSQRADGGSFVPAGKRDEYYPILFVQPSKEDQSLLGFDLGSDPACRTAIGQALATRRQAAVVCQPLAGKETDHALLYVVEPAWNEDRIRSKRPADQPEIDGFVVGVFQVCKAVETSLSLFAPLGIDLFVTGPADAGGNAPVFTRLSPLHSHEGAMTPAAAPSPPADGGMSVTGVLDVANLRCTVTCVPMDLYLARQHTWGPLGTLIAGLAITALLVGYLVLLTGRTARVEQLVAERTRKLGESERKLGAVLDQTYQFIGVLTPDGILTEANKSALAFSGVSESDVLNKPFWETTWWTHSPGLQEKLRQAVQRAAGGQFVRMEATHRAADGDLHWIDFSLKPVRDETGKVVFLIPEGRDITDRKRAEQAIRQEQRLLHEMLDLQERDRKLVAYEIHDGLAQQLTAALYKFQTAERLRDSDIEMAKEVCDKGVGLLREAMVEARRLISGLRPPVLDDLGVVAAIECLIAEHRQHEGLEIEFVHEAEMERLAPPLESALFRIAQECLTNACRYSQSKKVRVELRPVDDRIRIDVQDWGVGFDPEAVGGGHFGLHGIRERARLLGGTIAIRTAPQQGAHITVELPLVAQAESEIQANGPGTSSQHG